MTIAETVDSGMVVGGADDTHAMAADAPPKPKKRRKRTNPGDLCEKKTSFCGRTAPSHIAGGDSRGGAVEWEIERWRGGECEGRAGRGGWRELMAFDVHDLHRSKETKSRTFRDHN